MDRGLLLREITEQLEGDGAPGGRGGRPTVREPRIAITIAGPAGDHHTFAIPRSLIAGRDTNMGEMLRLAMDYDPDGADDDPGAIARRRTFINQVRNWLPQADNARYSMMLRRDAGGDTDFVDPATPVRISSGQDQDQSFQVSFAQVYTGGAGA